MKQAATNFYSEANLIALNLTAAAVAVAHGWAAGCLAGNRAHTTCPTIGYKIVAKIIR